MRNQLKTIRFESRTSVFYQLTTLPFFLLVLSLMHTACKKEEIPVCETPEGSQLSRCCPPTTESSVLSACFKIPVSTDGGYGTSEKKGSPLVTPNANDSFVILSNRIFVAVNWSPVLNQSQDGNLTVPENGIPDPAFSMGTGDNLALWESWRTTGEVLRKEGPLPWKLERPLPGSTVCKAKYQEELANLAKQNPGLSPARFRDLTGQSHYGPPAVLSDPNSGLIENLYDVNGNPVLYEVAMNKTAFDYIVDNGLFNRDGMERFLADSPVCSGPSSNHGDLDCDPLAPTHSQVCSPMVGFIDWKNRCSEDFSNSCQQKILFPGGEDDGETPPHQTSIFVKAAWKILTDKDKPARFHQSYLIIPPSSEQEECGSVQIGGLVSLHIVYKTNFDSGAPANWSWATFEHDSNAPPAGGKISGNDLWSFFNASDTDPTDCPLSANDSQNHQNIVRYHAARANRMTAESNFPYIKALKNSPWSNYSQSGVQWWSSSNPPVFQNDKYGLANSVIEPYIQRVSSCAQCHDTARANSSDTSYPTDGIFALGKIMNANN